MKKAFSLILALVLCLSMCACGAKYVCADCGEDYGHEPSKYSTNGACRDCYNKQSSGTKYCVCGNTASRSTKSGTYLCTTCWNNVENAVKNAFGG